VFRAVLRPHERGFYYLRLGAPEGWFTLSFVVLVVMLAIGTLGPKTRDVALEDISK